jgi:hypothetical protein
MLVHFQAQLHAEFKYIYICQAAKNSLKNIIIFFSLKDTLISIK